MFHLGWFLGNGFGIQPWREPFAGTSGRDWMKPGIYVDLTTALERAGIRGYAHQGAHIFRHSLATELLRSGATLSEIGQLLRHESHDTTRIYAKVDVDALRTLSLPWPGGVQ